MAATYERPLRIDIYGTNVNVALCEISRSNNNPFNWQSSTFVNSYLLKRTIDALDANADVTTI